MRKTLGRRLATGCDMRALIFLQALLVLGCAGRIDDAAQVETDIRRAYADSLELLAIDRFAVLARTDRELVAFLRDSRGAWAFAGSAALPDDWSAWTAVGFDTYVDEDRLRQSYQAYLAVVHRLDEA